jgi:hypothetical protein
MEPSIEMMRESLPQVRGGSGEHGARHRVPAKSLVRFDTG